MIGLRRVGIRIVRVRRGLWNPTWPVAMLAFLCKLDQGVYIILRLGVLFPVCLLFGLRKMGRNGGLGRAVFEND